MKFSLMKLIFILVLLWLSTGLNASPNSGPYNSNILVENGIPPQLLDMPLRFFEQGVAVTMTTRYYTLKPGSETRLNEVSFEIVYDPFGVAGVDTYMLIPKGTTSQFSERQIRNYLEDHMGLHFVSREAGHLYDQNSFVMLKDEPGHRVIGFKYHKNLLYAEAAFYKHSEGQVHIIDGEVDHLELITEQPYKSGEDTIVRTVDRLYLSRVPKAGGYLTDKFISELTTESGGRQMLESTATSYRDEQGNAIIWKTGELPQTPKQTDVDVVRVDLNRTLPFFGKEVRKLGYKLPKPIGIQVFTHSQKEDMQFTSLKLDGDDLSAFISPNGSSTNNTTNIIAARADVWLLPFLSLNALVGNASTSADITLKGGDIGVPDPDDPLGTPIIAPGGTVNIKEDGLNSLIMGLGTTIGFGYQNIFVSADIMFIRSVTQGVDVTLDAFVVTPMVGYTFNQWRLRVLAGGQYQDYDTTIKGSAGSLGNFEVSQSTDKWAGMLGVQKEFLRNWDASLMLGKGTTRTSATLVVGYRF